MFKTGMSVIATALLAALIALTQTDLKRVLAYSTVSQLGFMFMGIGAAVGHIAQFAVIAAVFHLFTHAFFKALLFLGSGSVIYAMHQAYHHTGSQDDAQDMRNMGGLRRHMPATWILMWIATLAIAGVPFFAGFFSKDEILGGAFSVTPPGWPVWYGKVLWVGLLIAAFGTAFYMWRLYFLVFGGDERSEAARKALGYDQIDYLRLDPSLTALRKDPRFTKLLEERRPPR